MELDMFTMDCSPEEQSRLTVEMGTSTGTPAAMAAARDTYNGDGGWHVPEEDYQDPPVDLCDDHAGVPTQISSNSAGLSLVFSNVA